MICSLQHAQAISNLNYSYNIWRFKFITKILTHSYTLVTISIRWQSLFSIFCHSRNGSDCHITLLSVQCTNWYEWILR